MKLHEVMHDPFRAQVEELLWQDYQQDPFAPADVEYPEQLDDEEYLEYGEHIDDIVKFAHQHRIRNPRVAIERYTDHVEKTIRSAFGKVRH